MADWNINDQLRERAGTTVPLDQADAAIGAALRGESPASTRQRTTTLPPEPPPTASPTDWHRWAREAAPVLDDQGRLPTERGYAGPAQDSFDAWAARERRRNQQRRADADRAAN
jgi:hypothetical protein